MKRDEKVNAIELRKQGTSINDIAKQLSVSKGSVSLWVRDVELSKTQRAELNSNGHSVDAIEKRRINRIRNTSDRHQIQIEKAKGEITSLSGHELLLVGASLYWGEGGKTKNNMARISNADPKIICLMMRFFKEICGVPQEKFRGHVHTFSHLNTEAAEMYWSEVSGIPRNQFYKTYTKPSIASKNKRDTLPFGTFQIYVCDTSVFLRIKGMIEKLGEFSLQAPV
jgi:transposase-like protein